MANDNRISAAVTDAIVTDIRALTASDSMLAYLSFYSNAKDAAKRNVPGADTIVANLARYFPTGRRPAPAKNPTP